MAQKIKKPDPILLWLLGGFLTAGFLFLLSASYPLALLRYQDGFYFLKQQLMKGFLVGGILLIIFYYLKWNQIRKIAIFIFLISLIFLILVLLPDFRANPKAARWLKIGPIVFQPSEFFKFTFLLYLSVWLPQLYRKKAFLENFFPFLVILLAVSMLILAEPALGNLAVIFGIAFASLFAVRAPVFHIVFLGLVTIFLFVIMVGITPYRLQRVLIFLNPNLDPQGLGYHLSQSRLAIGSGGILGKGLGASATKKKALPEVMTDSIFAVIAEELGFVGSFFLLLAYFYLTYRLIFLASKIAIVSGKIYLIGFSAWIFFQTVGHIGSLTGALPMTGLPLPFISYGGSALASLLAGYGLALNFSKK